MIADRRFVRPRPDTRVTAAIALSAALTIIGLAAPVYIALKTIEEPIKIRTHCGDLYDRARSASPAEEVRLRQEYHEAYCD